MPMCDYVWDQFGLQQPAAQAFAPNLVESLVWLDRFEDARLVSVRFADQAERSELAIGLALAARASGVIEVHEDPTATGALAQAVSLHGDDDDHFEVGRTHLAYGEALAASGKATQAERHLRRARARFAEIEARPWERKSLQALRGLGVADSGDPRQGVRLTAQERQVADSSPGPRQQRGGGRALCHPTDG